MMECGVLRTWRRAGFAGLVAVLTLVASAWATPQVDLGDGVFFEAEHCDGRPWYSDSGFGVRTPEALGSGGAVLIGMWKPGALSYELNVSAAGEYQVWMRCAVPAVATVMFGVNTTSAAELQATSVAATTTMAGLASAGAYQWRRLGGITLRQGANTFLLGQGAQRPDCFLLTRRADFTPGDDLVDEASRVRDAPRGQPLPELHHDRQISQHPRWLTAAALRPAYAHFEWDPTNTPQSWARMAREAGANCLVGVGEMPAGTLAGQMKAFPFQRIDAPGPAYPADYRQDDYAWVREYADAGHAEGLKVVMYGGAWRTLDPILVEHPDWRQQDIKGKPYPWGFGSWYSPYRAAYIERWVQVARDSGLDGIMVDMLFTCPNGGDWSPFTLAAFKQRFGVEPPRQEDHRNLVWQRWHDFQTWTREEVMLEVTEALHAVNPEIACIWNQTVGWVFTGREYLSSRAGGCADGLLEEMGWEVTHGAFAQRPFAWPLQSAWQSLFLHCRTTPGYGQMWHLNGFYTHVNHEALSYSMFANGVAPAVVAGGNWEYMQAVWNHIKLCEAPMSGAALVPYAALHFSENSLGWYANARGEDRRRSYLMSVFGTFQALLETHLPVTIVTDDDLADAARLRRHAVIVLPNSACLSDQQSAALTAYVEGGGGLVAAFETGMYDENGSRRGLPALQALLGVEQAESKGGVDWALNTAQSHEISSVPQITEGGDLSQGSRDRKPRVTFFAKHTDRLAQVVRSTALPGTESVALVGAGVGYSALHARRAGDGRAVYFPPDIGHGYFTYNHPIARLLIERALRWSAGTPSPLQTSAPLAVQTVCFRKGADVVVNVVNDNSSFGRAAAPNPESFAAFRDEVLPVYDIEVGVVGAFRQALLLPAGASLPLRHKDGWSTVSIPRVDIHAMVVFSP